MSDSGCLKNDSKALLSDAVILHRTQYRNATDQVKTRLVDDTIVPTPLKGAP